MSDSLQLGFTSMFSAEQRARDLLAGKGEIPLTPLEVELLRRMVWHRGHRNAIPRRDLELKLGLSERTVKGAVRSLIVTHQLAIGACRGKDHGYFLVETAEDLEIAGQPLISELREISRRLRVLYGPERVAELYGQLPLECPEINEKETA